MRNAVKDEKCQWTHSIMYNDDDGGKYGQWNFYSYQTLGFMLNPSFHHLLFKSR